MAAGNAVVGALRAELGLDSAQFEIGIKKAQGSLAKFGSMAATGFQLGAAAAVAAGAAIGVAMKSTIDNMEEMGAAAQSVGIPVAELSKLKYAADQSEVSFESLQKSAKRLSANMMSVASGAGGPAAGAFKALGVSVVDSDGKLKSSTEVMIDLAGKFSGMQDGAGKTALAMDIFGKSGADMIPFLNQGKDGIKGLTDEADQLGLTLSGEAAAAADQFNDNLGRMKGAGQGLVNQLTTAMLPTFVKVTDGLVGLVKNSEVMRGAATLLTWAFKGLVTAVIGAGANVLVIARTIAGAGKVMWQVAHGDFAGAAATVADTFRKNGQTVADTAKFIGDLWTDTGTKVAGQAPKLSDQLSAPMVEGAKKTRKAADDQKKALEDIQDAFDAFEKKRMEGVKDGEDLWGDYSTAEEKATAKMLADLARLDDRIRLGVGTPQQNAMLRERIIALGQDIPKLDVKVDLDLGDDLAEAKKAGEGFTQWADDREAEFRRVAEAADDIRYSLEGVLDGFKSGDWTQAARGLMSAFKGIKAAFDPAQGGGMANGMASVAQAAGGMIGGKFGGALAGAGSGFMMGSMLGGPIGGAIGAVAGGLMGFLGGGKAKKQAKAEAAEKERQRQEQIKDQHDQLNIRLLQITGQATAALAAQRALELAKIDASNQALQQLVWQEEDRLKAWNLEISLAAATGNMIGAVSGQRQEELKALEDSLKPMQLAIYAAEDLRAQRLKEVELLRLNGDEVAATALERQLELDVMDPAITAIQQLIWKRQDEIAEAEKAKAAFDDMLGGLQDVTQAAVEAAADFAKTQRSLEIDLMKAGGDSLAALNAERADELAALPAGLRGLKAWIYQVTDASAAYEAASKGVDAATSVLSTAVARVRQIADGLRSFAAKLVSNPLAMNSVAEQYGLAAASFAKVAANKNEQGWSQLQGVSESFLAASLAAAKTAIDYQRDLAKVKVAVQGAEDLADAQVDLGQAQLDALGAANDNLVSIKDAVELLAKAQKAKEQATVAVAQAKAGAAAGVGQMADLGFQNGQRVNLGIGPNGPIALFDGWEQAFPGLAATTPLSDAALIQLAIDQARSQLRAGLAGTGVDIEDRYGQTLAFAGGGSFKVGGSGGPDSQYFGMALSPGEAVDITRGGAGDGDLLSELRGANDRLDLALQALLSIEGNTFSTDKQLKGATREDAKPLFVQIVEAA